MVIGIPGYWLDKNVHQKFEFISRIDLIKTVIPLESLVATQSLIGEYEKYYKKQDDLKVKYEYSNYSGKFSIEYQNGDTVEKSEFRVIQVTEEEYKKLPVELSSLSEADQEGFILGQQGFILITDNFGHLRNKERQWSIKCFGSIDILKANILKETLHYGNAEQICKKWKDHDPKWVTRNFKDFSTESEKIDDQELKKYFNI